ncbi:FAD-dependent monooxygenase [Caldimonas thermodepolymerans]|jgi:2-polyprenyl-6-methoxyphenol hydroxylase-like FAD-dependent oxidoreductase|uniref:2-octaprenyl-3-methyl-6-methoxy-1,4-benzoquinol hydroxylase n=1 Tax=Caldimonas thermodepolymerans TaxID=215580 RepID=A0A2S5T8I3_9BURK|nr:FAD-dependent monooxygenase [Caldimonas thermodepolymerans]PPE71256.1 2-octaprenyl-3-methyl-6-methoxy-1,4-benzoquinol hydroxylase [Caldimonas thermodepolymerans]QPC32430.1 FAD-dependent monooxygenase [Caldimonas thermodepolymerans]RDH98817.1 ubiquinone biosynthesis UbiH/UbiF/VisC/COQ6 family hydroxylase [Caldimonas thermodepolymerans]TCP06215.1 ubiquinone biosynthesis UbiH/UbiF/VisC/COQ6 family hydroxylase [Caldimonas thermodepolymerans]UZG45226.1 FAD-dependent monooxygenase [Caldimonas the
MVRYDVYIRGSGIVGKTLALALARAGLGVALQRAPGRPAGQDVRAYALSARSVALLRSVKAWDALPPDAATPVYDMHIEGDAPGHQLLPGVLEFSAWEQQLGELAWIVDAQALEDALAQLVRFQPHVSEVDAPIEAALTAICEGKASAAREALGVEWVRHPYGHTAIAARLASDRPHNGVARQWFRSPDVLALLPFDRPDAGRSYGLVWSLPEARAQELMALDEAGFMQALQEATGDAAGALALRSERAAWPLAIARASRCSGEGWVLLGDAAHVVHPLAGQGLNLGLADVDVLARVLREREPWRPVGDAKLLRRYERTRAAPTWAMGQLTDGLLHLFAASAPAVRELRNRGLGLVNHLSPVKRWLTRRALDS